MPRRFPAYALAPALVLALVGCTGPVPDAPTRPGSLASSTPAGTTDPTATPSAPAGRACPSPGGTPRPEVTGLPLRTRSVALTFDVEYDDAGVDPVLRTLAHEGVPATFFVSPLLALTDPAHVRAMAAVGRVGLLVSGASIEPEDLSELVRSGRDTLRRVLGHEPAPLARFPVRESASALPGVAARACVLAVRWTVDAGGWVGIVGGQTEATVVRTVQGGAAPGAVVRMVLGANPTDGSTLDADALPGALAALRSDGYAVVDLEDTLTR